jgi:hypothetical protein
MSGSRRTSQSGGAGMQNGRLFVFSTMVDGRIVFNRAQLGGPFQVGKSFTPLRSPMSQKAASSRGATCRVSIEG